MPIAVCLFGLDDLEKVNDTYGLEMGDRMLHTFADLLRSKTRSGDIHCRCGGDAFILVLRRMASSEAAVTKSTEICRAFHEFLRWRLTRWPVPAP